MQTIAGYHRNNVPPFMAQQNLCSVSLLGGGTHATSDGAKLIVSTADPNQVLRTC